MDYQALPEGVKIFNLNEQTDHRGILFEIFRLEWETEMHPVQWNLVHSNSNVLRGVHVHLVHDDYLLLLQGRLCIGLRDLREQSRTYNHSMIQTFTANKMQAIKIPHGVAHGFYFPEPSIHIYSVSHYWDPEDELGCHWADSHLEIPWPCHDPLLSEKDRNAHSLSELLKKIKPLQTNA